MDESSASGTGARRRLMGEFPAPTILSPAAMPHTSTIIFLHGRGWDARKFSDSILSMVLPRGGTLRDALPRTRFVFPTAPLMRATKYRRTTMHQWYEGTGDWEPEARGNMRPSVEFIQDLLDREMQLVCGDSTKLCLAGFSQGCAMAIMNLLLWNGAPLGAVVGLCGFIPINSYLLDILDDAEESDLDDFFETTSHESKPPVQRAIDELREEVELPQTEVPSRLSFRSTPVFLGHGVDDDEVELRHSENAALLLKKMGTHVTHSSYPGLGHGYSPKMLEDMVLFLTSNITV
ncbi:putative acyl-protein thioesterase 1,2 [Stachybotrys elegans]|uniref:Acyl-protein thioesterase 1,2 n=1 Tax=Stachybotrys elegans TaxID=80388 RepID=A0A8K0SQ69_9HYPO|nr:putative acyl-protein thioesterase 1,2 [Stachybotrys elegans]